jgi:hypothetical protein
MAWKATGDTDLPLADREREWDSDAATSRVFRWAGWSEHPAPEKARHAFFACNEDEEEHKSAYKLPFADVINGELKTVPRAIFAVAGVLDGARGGVDLPKPVQESIRRKVARYYHHLEEEPPWDKKA